MKDEHVGVTEQQAYFLTAACCPPPLRAIKLAAELDEPDEMNFVRKHAKEQAAEMGMSVRQAATRIFSNSSGSYSSNVNLAVENSSWSDEQQLQEMYLKRKSFAFNSDRWAASNLAPAPCN